MTKLDLSRSLDPEDGLRITDLTHRFGKRRVVAELSLVVPRGEVHCLVGPSGCGKTTTLRLVAGLERLQEGRISINDRTVAAPGKMLPPEARRVGLMFQDFALFPHLRVDENVAFGLTGRNRREREARVVELLSRVNMESYAKVYPHTLSGGEQQRVALARALAPAPDLMLLDEAFSALDTSLRAQIREETVALLRETGTPTLLVTHDAEEAIQIGHRIHAMQHGRIVQSGSPSELYQAPADPFVAGFFGPVNRFVSRVEDGRATTPLGQVEVGAGQGDEVTVIIRPEAIRLYPLREGAGTPRGRVTGLRDLGPMHLLSLDLLEGGSLRVRQTGRAGVVEGELVDAELDMDQVFVFGTDA